MLSIFNNEEKKTSRLKLVEEGDHIKLVCVDSSGRPIVGGYLMLFHKETLRVRRCECVDEEFGFMLDSNRRIVIENE